jgi:hypothetical protein
MRSVHAKKPLATAKTLVHLKVLLDSMVSPA